MRRAVARTLLAVAVAIGGVAGLTACSGGDSGTQPTSDAVVIDVRTPDEFSSGHLDGALNIDVEAADFGSRIGELDPDANYVLYCRSGNRAGVAASQMSQAGFAHVTNAGSLEQAAAATGLAIVTG